MKVGRHKIDVIYVVVVINFITAACLISFATLYSTSNFLVGLRSAPSGANFNVFDFVDPLIGTQNQGEHKNNSLDLTFTNSIFRSCFSRRKPPFWYDSYKKF